MRENNKFRDSIDPYYYDFKYYQTNVRRYLLDDIWSIVRKRDVLTAICPRQGEKILDAGCGLGTFSIEAYKRGAQVYAIDYSKKGIEIAKELSNIVLGLNEIKFLVSSVCNLPFEDMVFDKIICADLVEHILKKEFELFLKESYRVLKKKGELLIYTPNTESKKSLWKLFGGLFKNIEFPWLEKKFYSKYCFPILNEKAIAKDDKKYDFLHLDVKDPSYIINCLKRNKFKLKKIKCTRSTSAFQTLPFPLNRFWGGHFTFLARKK